MAQPLTREPAGLPAPHLPLVDLGVTLKATRPRCFRSDERLRCTATGCPWRKECRRLVAEWLR
ncbi:MAG: hypothetical protein RLW61_03740 [Gammaproteobacteria bacterium]